MARRMSTMLAAGAVALATPFASTSCVDDSVSIRVECSIKPEADDTGCAFDPGGTCLLEGRLNIASAVYYHGAVRVTNALKSRASDVPVQGETNGIQITEFEIEVLNTAGGRLAFKNLPNPFRIATSGFIPVGGAGIGSGDFLPTAYVKQLATQEMGANMLGQIIVSLIVRGKTQGDVDVETAPWHWPIRLFNLPPTPPKCQLFDSAVCNTGQDDYVNACSDQTQSM
jgi:hypothetical protein